MLSPARRTTILNQLFSSTTYYENLAAYVAIYQYNKGTVPGFTNASGATTGFVEPSTVQGYGRVHTGASGTVQSPITTTGAYGRPVFAAPRLITLSKNASNHVVCSASTSNQYVSLTYDIVCTISDVVTEKTLTIEAGNASVTSDFTVDADTDVVFKIGGQISLNEMFNQDLVTFPRCKSDATVSLSGTTVTVTPRRQLATSRTYNVLVTDSNDEVSNVSVTVAANAASGTATVENATSVSMGWGQIGYFGFLVDNIVGDTGTAGKLQFFGTINPDETSQEYPIILDGQVPIFDLGELRIFLS